MASNMEVKALIGFLLCLGMWVAQITASRSLQSEDYHSSNSMVKRHEEWMANFGRVYKDSVEKEKRFKIFKENVEFIEAFNNRASDYKLSVNAFADLTNEEFTASRNGFKTSVRKSFGSTPFRYESVTAVPDTVDWRKKGVVTPIKDQGQCGK